MRLKKTAVCCIVSLLLFNGCACYLKSGEKCSVFFDFNLNDVDLTVKNLDNGTVIHKFGNQIEIQLYLGEHSKKYTYEITAQKAGCDDYVTRMKLKKNKRYYVSFCK